MTQTLTSRLTDDILRDSMCVLEMIEHHYDDIVNAAEVLARHRALHRELELHHHLGQQTLMAWRTALTRRWECEIASQRLYKRILRQIQEHFGDTSPHYQAIAPMSRTHGITPSDLLNDLYRTRASLLLMQPLPKEIQATLDQFEAVCDDLAAAIALTNELEQKRRNTMIDERLTQDIYQRVRCETQFMLSECLRERVVANGHIAEPVELLLS